MQAPDLESRIARRLQEHAAQQQQRRQDAAAECRERQLQRQRFQRLGQKLLGDLIVPRLHQLERHFENATVQTNAGADLIQAECRFQHSERFPATARLTFACHPDTSMTHWTLTYDLDVLPLFLSFVRHDERVVDLEALDAEDLGQWLNDKIMHCVDVCLQVEANDRYSVGELVIDPVCGTRFDRRLAAATCELHGATYYFVSESNCRSFTETPERYQPLAKGGRS
ncbi:MAG: YHS domain-containing protein [Pirellulales bacterium]|nr:YHS domain-containing protein [Pirellulales bacterium]